MPRTPARGRTILGVCGFPGVSARGTRARRRLPLAAAAPEPCRPARCDGAQVESYRWGQEPVARAGSLRGRRSREGDLVDLRALAQALGGHPWRGLLARSGCLAVFQEKPGLLDGVGNGRSSCHVLRVETAVGSFPQQRAELSGEGNEGEGCVGSG